MKQRIRRWTACLLAAALMMSLAACAGEEGTTLRVCLGGAQESLDPAHTHSDDNATILYHLYENLFRQHSEGVGEVTLIPAVCAEYTETDNFDGTVSYAFTISPAAKWSDGAAVTALDFVYSWRRLLTEGGENRELLSMIEGYDEALESGDAEKLALRATEEGTLEVTLSYHCPYFLTAVCAGAATMPVREDAVAHAGESFGTSAEDLITNGAYVLESWEKDTQLSLVRNSADDSTGGVERLQFLFFSDREEAYRSYTSGAIDYIAYLPDDAIEKLKQSEDWTPTATGMIEGIWFNRNSAAFDDAALREIFTLSADVDALEQLLLPADQIATGLVPYGIRESDGEDFRTAGGAMLDLRATEYAERCREAKELLRQQETLPWEVELIYLADETRQAQVEALRTGWQDHLGIRVVLTALSEEELAQRLASGEYDMAWLRVTASCADGSEFLESGSAPVEDTAVEVTAEYDRLMGVLRGALDPLARDNYLHAAEEMMLSSYSVLPLIFKGTTQQRSDRVRGVGYDGLGRYLFHDVRLES